MATQVWMNGLEVNMVCRSFRGEIQMLQSVVNILPTVHPQGKQVYCCLAAPLVDVLLLASTVLILSKYWFIILILYPNHQK